MAFIALGVLLLFDNALLALGNILMIFGIIFIVGVPRTRLLLFHRNHFISTLLFITGFVLVLGGWAKMGLVVEGMGGLSYGHAFDAIYEEIDRNCCR